MDVQNQTNDQHLFWLSWWNDADFVVQSVFILLLGLSVVSWSIIAFKAWQFASIGHVERQTRDLFYRSRGRLEGPVDSRHPSGQLVAEAAACGGDCRQTLEANLGHMTRQHRLDLEGGLTVLATIGSSTPFIGLLGTVWGIMHALQGLGGEAALSMDMVAGPVAEALVATALGLFTAIPAVIGYNLLLRRLRRLCNVIDGNALRILDATMRPAVEREYL